MKRKIQEREYRQWNLGTREEKIETHLQKRIRELENREKTFDLFFSTAY